MKIIKFRAYDNQTKRFEYWNSEENKYDGVFWEMVKRPEFEKPEQYTGHKDSNGKEIYEGDTISWDDDGSNYPNVVHRKQQVEWEKANNFSPMLFCGTKYEVTGNTYEKEIANP